MFTWKDFKNRKYQKKYLEPMLKSEGGQIKLFRTHQCLGFPTEDTKDCCCDCNKNRLGASL